MSVPLLAGSLSVGEASDPAERLAFLFDSHYERLYRLARRLANHQGDAQDLVQETFLKAAQHAHRIPIGASNEEAWLVRVLINLRRDQWRKKAVRERHSQTATEASTPGSSPDPEAVLIARTAVWDALNTLPPRRRAIVVLSELEGMATPAIASLLGITAITVRWHLSKGKSDLHRALKAFIGDTK
jgi:RNA polymerase sigma-70 factor (ECF subfamily)